jgi:hypothetical protein
MTSADDSWWISDCCWIVSFSTLWVFSWATLIFGIGFGAYFGGAGVTVAGLETTFAGAGPGADKT